MMENIAGLMFEEEIEESWEELGLFYQGKDFITGKCDAMAENLK